MDETAVRQAAQAHGDATVAGDLSTAGRDLTPEAMSQAGGVMKGMPRTLNAAEIQTVEIAGDEAVVTILYAGDDGAATVVSRWAERDGVPKIVDLQLGG